MPALVAVALAAQSVVAMRWHRRVVIVSAPRNDDPELAEQRKALTGWRGAAERDVSVVYVVGDTVTGASDTAFMLRQAYDLSAGRFVIALIGKDGRVAVRTGKPIPDQRIEGIIDAMPMRRAGQR